MLKKSRHLTRPTLVRQDSPSHKQGRRRVETGGGTAPHFVEPFARTIGSWRTEKPLQCGRPPSIAIGTLRISMSRERNRRSFSTSCYEVRDCRSNKRIARHPAATPAANMTPTIQPEEKPILLGSRRRSSRFRFGMWDSGPSH